MTITSPTAFRAAQSVQRVTAASRRVQQPQSSGDLVSLAMGEPDFATPLQVVEAAATALRAGRTHYSPLYGEPALRSALADRIGALADRSIDTNDILVTHGGTGGLTAAILAIVDPGDRVVIPDPTYSLYADLISMAGGIVVPVPLQPDLHWDLDALDVALVGAKLFIFCNPGNPTGIVHSRAELERLGAALEGTDTIVISDEAYADLTFTGEAFTSTLEVSSLVDRTVYCQTFSKSYAMTGWRVGYLWGPNAIIAAAARVHNTANGSMNTAVQDAALVALESCADDIARMRDAYGRRRALMADGLATVPGLDVSSPEGAFYLFPRYDLDIPSVEIVARLRDAGVAVRPGSEFGAAGEHHLRLSYAASDDAIKAGVARLATAFGALR
ncbi:pyridoxal phosphate-dependent aminotransferase [Curtobacterium sp. VKM Ac-2887]|uniref:pyridoxal phosphate-dependent aminotransferase n=1 Tax=Curtobacterium sp. VKM Ac-2887 TaxID=2783819 RepID=UPI00188AD93A|nr:aminotransferase class I/II-fold pyridoxal phosphate-dependent enzyme [Curtobacterium sp. VKM Ac-2887]MBF4588278.1 aminotransferase class I/II-fold pyridoxal phosphate-dependent enzyme [Curtobacterium sp. VKM Ac-2887]